MEKPKLLIADPGMEFRQILAERLQGSYIIRQSWEGPQTLELLRRFRPELLLLDLMMPGLDGLSLLQTAAEAGIRPVVLATTRYATDYTLQVAEEIGVSYVMVKPCDIQATIRRLADLTRRIEPPDPGKVVTDLLLSLNIPVKAKGFPCLREALLEATVDPRIPLTTVLYPRVAQRCGGDGRRVERLIRIVIEKGWEQRDEKVWRLYFQPDQRGQLKRPTNGAFISAVASRLNAGGDFPKTEE